MKRLAVIGLAILLALLITGGVQAGPIEPQYAQELQKDTTAPHLEITETSYNLGSAGFFDEFPTTLEATRVERVVAQTDARDLDHVEFVIRPQGEETWNLIDAGLSVSESGLIWELSGWDVQVYDCGWYEVSAVGVDQVGNVDQWPAIVRVYARHGQTAQAAAVEPLRLLTAAPSVTSGPTTFRFAALTREAGQLSIYDTSGRRVHHAIVSPGINEVTWSGQSDYGDRVASGVYFIRLDGQRSSEATTRIVITR
jgi:hypothetical protein